MEKNKIDILKEKEQQVLAGGGEKAIARQHAAGKYTARERIEKLLDAGSFHETDRFIRHRCNNFGMETKEIPADAVVTGWGTIGGRKVFIYAQDFTVVGGALGEMHAAKICKVMDMALEAGVPIIGINDSGGARIQEGIDSLSGFGDIFLRNSLNSGKIPQISVIMGPCAGGAVYSPALTDLVIMLNQKSQMFITGPAVIEATTGEEITAEELGGADTHTMTSGVAHLSGDTEEEVFDIIRTVLSYLPDNCDEKAPAVDAEAAAERCEALNEIIPENSNMPYDIHDVIDQLVDPESFFEIQPYFADNAVIGFARLAGRSVGVVANQPFSCGGALDINASDKIARFVQLCNCFNLPLVTLVDVPGFLPGSDQEHGGIIRHGAMILYAYSVAEVPKLTVVLRKAYGGAYIGMCSKGLGADLVMAWPSAEIAVMGAAGACNIIFSREIKASENPEETRKQRIAEYTERFATPYAAAEHGYVDMVIEPAETRKELIAGLKLFENKKRSGRVRSNMPL
jgi:acetyl-CoA carboxylase carboxyltransferase component